MREYLNLAKNVLDNGIEKKDRTKVGTISIFGTQTRYDLEKGFPLLTTKKVNFNAILHELLWFLKGDTNIEYLVKNNVNIWNEWPYEKFKKSKYYNGESLLEFIQKIKENPDFAKMHGDLGPVYGKQWRNFLGVDQINNVISSIKNDPNSRRHIVSAWNPTEVDSMLLPPCHSLFQFYVINNKLSLQLYQRSADLFLGVPFNIASYSILNMLVAHHLGMENGEFIHTTGDTHIYLNHIDQIKEQLSRTPRKLPKLIIKNKKENIWDYTFEDFELQDYNPHPIIKGKVAV
ncbi:MAG: thymidylate synthase [Candidatus Tyloplasma litorale]|nr:MAG: thymidylate synthase [Mycoplasmatales bacterium]